MKMEFQVSRSVVQASLLLTILLACGVAQASTADSSKSAFRKSRSGSKEAKLQERVEVTGSRIKQKAPTQGYNVSGCGPLYVIDRAQIQRTGASSVAELLQKTTPGFR